MLDKKILDRYIPRLRPVVPAVQAGGGKTDPNITAAKNVVDSLKNGEVVALLQEQGFVRSVKVEANSQDVYSIDGPAPISVRGKSTTTIELSLPGVPENTPAAPANSNTSAEFKPITKDDAVRIAAKMHPTDNGDWYEK